MNGKQKVCLWIGIIVIVAMTTYPPWVCSKYYSSPTKVTTETGPYSLITAPPKRAKFIDLYRLGVQWVVVAIVTGGLIITFKDRKTKDEQKQ